MEKFAARVERYFSMLKLRGVFNKVSGVILGKHRKGGYFSGSSGWAKAPHFGGNKLLSHLPVLTLPAAGFGSMRESRGSLS